MSNENWKDAFHLGYAGDLINSNNNQHLKSKHNIFIYQRIISDIIPLISAIAGYSSSFNQVFTSS